MRLDFWTQCTKCGLPSRGRLAFDEGNKLVDSDGGVLFGTGWTCHKCVGEPWSSADLPAAVWSG